MPRKRGLDSLSIIGVRLGKKEGGVVFLRGFDTSMHTMLYVYVCFLNIFYLFFNNKNIFFSFSFLFSDEISNICNRILTNRKPE